MDMSWVFNQYVTSSVVALVVSTSLVWLVWSSRSAISQVLGRLFTRTAFFWLINIVFMAISAYHAAPFFGSVVSTIPGLEWAAQYIGLPVALVIDGVTIVFMQARMEASYKRDDKKRDMYTRYVFAAAGLNTIANLYTDIEHFQASNYTHLWPLMQGLAPVVLSVFPMFLVAISKAADEMVNIKPLDKLNVQEFEAQELKRVQILEVQALYLEREAVAMQRLIQIESIQKQNELLRKGATPKSFRWWWEKPFEIAAQDALIADLQQQLADIKVDMSTAKSGHDMPDLMDIKADKYEDIDESESGQGEWQESDVDTDPEVDAVNVLQFHPHRTSSGQKVSVKVPVRRKSMSAKEAAAFLECSDRQVRRLRENGTLVADEDDRLTSASVKAYKKKRAAKFG